MSSEGASSPRLHGLDDLELDGTGADVVIVRLETGEEGGRKSFFDAVRAAVDLDPPVVSERSYLPAPHAARILSAQMVDLDWMAATAHAIGRCDASATARTSLHDGRIRVTPPRTIEQLHTLSGAHLTAYYCELQLDPETRGWTLRWLALLVRPACDATARNADVAPALARGASDRLEPDRSWGPGR